MSKDTVLSVQGSTRRSATRPRREGLSRSGSKAGRREGAGHPPPGSDSGLLGCRAEGCHQRADSVVMRSLQNTQPHRPISQRSKRVWALLLEGSKVTPPGSSTADALHPSDPEEPRCRLGRPASSPTWGCRWRFLSLKSVYVWLTQSPWHECSGQAHPQRPRQEPVT